MTIYCPAMRSPALLALRLNLALSGLLLPRAAS
jgi:hypothetical protein